MQQIDLIRCLNIRIGVKQYKCTNEEVTECIWTVLTTFASIVIFSPAEDVLHCLEPGGPFQGYINSLFWI